MQKDSMEWDARHLLSSSDAYFGVVHLFALRSVDAARYAVVALVSSETPIEQPRTTLDEIMIDGDIAATIRTIQTPTVEVIVPNRRLHPPFVLDLAPAFFALTDGGLDGDARSHAAATAALRCLPALYALQQQDVAHVVAVDVQRDPGSSTQLTVAVASVAVPGDFAVAFGIATSRPPRLVASSLELMAQAESPHLIAKEPFIVTPLGHREEELTPTVFLKRPSRPLDALSPRTPSANAHVPPVPAASAVDLEKARREALAAFQARRQRHQSEVTQSSSTRRKPVATASTGAPIVTDARPTLVPTTPRLTPSSSTVLPRRAQGKLEASRSTPRRRPVSPLPTTSRLLVPTAATNGHRRGAASPTTTTTAPTPPTAKTRRSVVSPTATRSTAPKQSIVLQRTIPVEVYDDANDGSPWMSVATSVWVPSRVAARSGPVGWDAGYL